MMKNICLSGLSRDLIITDRSYGALVMISMIGYEQFAPTGLEVC